MSKTKMISARLPEELIQALDEVSASEGASRSAIINTLLKNRLPKRNTQLTFVQHDDAVKFYTSLFQIFDEMNAIKNELNKIGVNYNQEVKALNRGHKKSSSSAFDTPRSLLEIELNMNEKDDENVTTKLDINALKELVIRYEKASRKVDETLCLIQP